MSQLPPGPRLLENDLCPFGDQAADVSVAELVVSCVTSVPSLSITKISALPAACTREGDLVAGGGPLGLGVDRRVAGQRHRGSASRVDHIDVSVAGPRACEEDLARQRERPAEGRRARGVDRIVGNGEAEGGIGPEGRRNRVRTRRRLPTRERDDPELRLPARPRRARVRLRPEACRRSSAERARCGRGRERRPSSSAWRRGRCRRRRRRGRRGDAARASWRASSRRTAARRPTRRAWWWRRRPPRRRRCRVGPRPGPRRWRRRRWRS